jgi:hypothetical protein
MPALHDFSLSVSHFDGLIKSQENRLCDPGPDPGEAISPFPTYWNYFPFG